MSLPPRCALALDLGTETCGYAYGMLTDPMPKFDHWRMHQVGGRGRRYVSLDNTLWRALNDWQITEVVVESPLSLMALVRVEHNRIVLRGDPEIIRQQHVLAGYVEGNCFRASIPYMECSADKVRSDVMGRSRFAKGQTKNEVMAYCRSIGLPVLNDHQADACILWLGHRHAIMGRRPAAGPLFRHRAIDA